MTVMTERHPEGGRPARPDPGRWGVAYRGAGEVEDVVSATADALGRLGVLCEIRRVGDGGSSIRGVTHLPCYRLLAGSHPQRVDARVEPRSDAADGPGGAASGVRLSLDLTLVGWYRGLILALWSTWAAGLCAVFAWTDPGQLRAGAAEGRALLPAVLAVLGVAAWTPFLLRSLGGARLQATLWQPILRAVDRTGGRSRLRRRLDACRVAQVESYPSLRGAGTHVQRVAAGPEVYLAVTPGEGVKAIAHRFAWPRRRWIVEISTGALEELAPDEIEALVAHELAHLRHGHALIRDLVLWVGRAAFVGDGFCRALLNSFGWEAEADREAARMLGERKWALVRCLWRVRDLNSLGTAGSWPAGARDRGRTERSNEAGGPAGGGTGGGTGGDASSGGGPDRPARWRDVWWERFLQHYLGGSALDYWHPVTDERVARLQAFDAGSGQGAAS